MYKESSYNKFFLEKGSIFLFNSFSKACIKIEKKDLERIKKLLKEKNLCKGVENKSQKVLIKNGFIIPKETNELEILEYLYKSNYFSTSKIAVALVPTLRCNFRCPYCFEAKSRKGNNESKDYFEVLKKFSDKNFKNKKKVHIGLFGGEPLLKRKELFSYLEYLLNQSEKYGYKLSTNIVTNGFFLDEETVKKLLKYKCISIQITLDGGKETHNKLRVPHNGEETFDKIVNNFKRAIKYSIKIKSQTKFILRVNLLNQKVEDLKSIFEAFDEKERKKINVIFRPVYSTSQFKQINCNTTYDLKKFYDKSKEYGYGAAKNNYYFQYCESDGGINFFYITPDLKIWKCINEPTKTANIGHLNKNGEMKLDPTNIATWSGKSNPFKDEKCKKCYYLPVCYGGCPLYRIKTGKRRCTTKDMAITPYFYN